MLSSPFRRRNHLLTAALAIFPSVLLSGCTMGEIALSGSDTSPVTVGVHMTGTVHGGQQPVTGATIQLYAAGSTGYGSTANPLIVAGGIGSLTITNPGAGYTSAPTVTITGGGTNATGATATAALGSGSTSDKIATLTLTNQGTGYTTAPTITFTPAIGNTPTTTATATAVVVPAGGVLSNASGNFSITGEFTCPTASTFVYIAATNGNPGLVAGTSNNGIRLVAPLGACGNLTNATTVFLNEVTTAAMAFAMGQYFTTSYGGASIDSFGIPNPATNPQAQIGFNNAYATILSLVNTTSGNALTSATYSTSGVGTITVTPESAKLYTIANILASCVNSTSNVSSNCSTLLQDVTPTGARQAADVLQAAVYMSLYPTDGSAANLAAVYGLQAATAAPYPGLSTQPNDWTLGITYASNSTSTAGTYILGAPSLLAIDSNGNVWVGNNSTSNGSLTELSPTGTPLLNVLNTSNISNPTSLVIDTANDVYVSNYYAPYTTGTPALTNQVVEYTAAGATKTFNTGYGPGAMVADKAGDIFVVDTSTTGGGANVVKIPSGAATGTTATSIGAVAATQYSGIVMDQNFNIWVGGGSNASGYQIITPFKYSAPSGVPTWTVGTAGNPGCITAAEGAAIDSTGNIWLPNYASPGTLCEIYASSTGAVTGLATAISGANGGLNNSGHIITDGASNLWLSNQTTATETVSEFTDAGAPLSSATGFAHNYDQPFMTAIDLSGNVWSGNYSITASGTVAGYINELVGAAAPTITPIAAGLPTAAGGTMLIGTRP